ncbi:MAG: ketopantoate reductase family protein, partial [Ancrocorticia sp.]|uniref:ketopantoate reductase family protein n=1 Tax=Ancrocorticia sp. TaxID=2593684 RepID=UPI003F91DA01
LSTKAYGLDEALSDIAPFVGPDTTIIPVLNGMSHIDRVSEVYPGQVIGGIVKIVGTIEGDTVRQMTPLITMIIGSLNGEPVSPAIIEALDVPGFSLTVSPNIRAALWEKWAFIASAGVITCLFRGPVGRIIEYGGLGQIYAAISEGEAVAAAAGYPVSQAGHQGSLNLLTEEGSGFTSSLYRDLASGHAHEGEHILGEMAVQARRLGVSTPLLDLTLLQIRTDTGTIG